MRIQQLLYLQKVVALGNMTEAAKELFIAQPTLSSAIKQLEKEMGITILIRGKKGVSLTEDGREFMQYAQQILDQVQLLERRYGDQSSAPKIFSVAAQHYAFAVDAFVQLLKEIGQSDYQASLKEMRTYEVIEDVADRLLVQRHFASQGGEGLGEALCADITHQTGRGLTLAVEVSHRLEQGLAAACAAIAAALDEDFDRLAMRRRVLERLLLRAVAIQATALAQRARCPTRHAFGFDDVAVFVTEDFERLQAPQLQEVGHSVPRASPH